MRRSWSSSSRRGKMDRRGARSRAAPGPRRALRVRPRSVDVRKAGGMPCAVWARTATRVRHDDTDRPGTWTPRAPPLTAPDGCGSRRCRRALRIRVLSPAGPSRLSSVCGGSCYRNNSAVAAAALADRLGGPVAVLDIDAHHGNGTQEISIERGDMLVGSVHVDPGAGGFALRRLRRRNRQRRRRGCEQESPVGAWRRRRALARCGERARRLGAHSGATSLVVPLGVDAAAGDPRARSA